MHLNLKDLGLSGALDHLKDTRRGLEKESLRVDLRGNISKKDHPKSLGSALTNSYITTDFSEALLELVTPTFTKTQDCLDFLTELHSYVHLSLKDEMLWPLSMPCLIESDDEIKIGKYGNSNLGKIKSIYRKGLSHRYGSKMQAIAGIHYNFSFSDSFIKKIQEIKGDSNKSFKQIKSEVYLSVARNFKRYEWLYFLLFGASPSFSESFTEKVKGFKKISKGGFYGEHSTSLRMGDLGYISQIQDDLNISINSVDEYIKDLKGALTKKHDRYEEIGEFIEQERIQLNTSIIQIENEYYSTIRPKRVCPSGERPINILRSEGIEYLELRCVDLDPFSPIGIERSQIDFLDLLLLLCLIKESPSLDKEESAYLKENHRRVINCGRSPDLQIYFENKEVNAITLAKSLISQMYEICQELGQFSSEIDHWIKSLKEQEEKIKNLELTPSGKLIKKITKEGLSHQDLGVEIAFEHFDFFQHYNGSLKEDFKKEAFLSTEKQANIESEEELSFEDYLKEFLNKVS